MKQLIINTKNNFKEKVSEMLNKNASEWPKVYSANFIEPGLISYEEQGLGKCYVSKEVLDLMAPSFVGRPVVNSGNHIDGMKPSDFEDVAGGVITKVYWKDNWYWADFIVWDQNLKNQIEKEGYSVSCAYKVTGSNDKGGIRNNIKYDQEVTNGEGTHLAIVPNPRYNGARIILNSIQGGSMKVKAWLKRLGAEFKNAIAPEGSMVDVDGEKVPVQEIVSAYEDEQKESAAKEKAEAEAKAAEAAKEPAKEEEIGEESTITIGGKEVTIKDALNCYRNRKNRKNAADQESKKKAEEEAKKKADKEAEEKKNAEEAEKKKKVDEEAKAAAEKAESEKAEKEKAETERKNALEKERHYLELKNKAESREKENLDGVTCVEEKRQSGKNLYGSEK
jgi:hypothetical protein